MRTLLALGWIGLLLAPGADAKQTNKPDLKLVASIDMAAPEQQPILVIHIINQAGHVLHIPGAAVTLQGRAGCVFAGSEVCG